MEIIIESWKRFIKKPEKHFYSSTSDFMRQSDNRNYKMEYFNFIDYYRHGYALHRAKQLAEKIGAKKIFISRIENGQSDIRHFTGYLSWEIYFLYIPLTKLLQ